MKIKTGDTVIVVAGKDKGKKGKVLNTMPKKNKVVVEGVNIQTKHEKPKGPESPGGIQKSEGPIDASNVMYYDSKADKGSRIGYKVENGTKVRVSKSSGQEIK
ncbi:50S ribosomal protein L24 [Peptostreptococcaceae bacterium OttesenSCG-928-C18]|nr:50S ribosomal protein L24 [Peptostreptococcaceae bacterium OttesenSCG-928-C18]